MSSTPVNIWGKDTDLQTYDEMDKYQYERNLDAFNTDVKKSMWVSQQPFKIPDFDENDVYSSPVTPNTKRFYPSMKYGNYLLHVWLRVKIPAVSLTTDNKYGSLGTIRWTKNLLHNLVEECNFSLNDLTCNFLDSTRLDFWTAFTTPVDKRKNYKEMIGNIEQLTKPHGPGEPIEEKWLTLPVPFFFTRDTTVAFPLTSCGYVRPTISLKLRNLKNLLEFTDGINYSVPEDEDVCSEWNTTIECWGNYASIGKEAQQKLITVPRDMLIEQMFISRERITKENVNSFAQPLRFCHSVKALLFGVQNITHSNVKSNYAVNSAFGPKSPLKSASLVYICDDDNSIITRLDNMESDYFTTINPWYSGFIVPDEIGYHAYSYARNSIDITPSGSTNFTMLVNVQIRPIFSDDLIAAVTSDENPQTFEFFTIALSTNILRFNQGTAGFPIL